MATGSWWVIPEGFLGKLANAFTVGPALGVWTTVQGPSRPQGAVAGPYATLAEAQDEVKRLNAGQGYATPGNIAKSGASAVKNDIFGNTDIGHWILRIGEVVLGIVLIAVGVAHVTKAVPVATKIAKTAGAGALLI